MHDACSLAMLPSSYLHITPSVSGSRMQSSEGSIPRHLHDVEYGLDESQELLGKDSQSADVASTMQKSGLT